MFGQGSNKVVEENFLQSAFNVFEGVLEWPHLGRDKKFFGGGLVILYWLAASRFYACDCYESQRLEAFDLAKHDQGTDLGYFCSFTNRGFLSKKGEAYGRPVGVVLDKPGALLVADDVVRPATAVCVHQSGVACCQPFANT